MCKPDSSTFIDKIDAAAGNMVYNFKFGTYEDLFKASS